MLPAQAERNAPTAIRSMQMLCLANNNFPATHLKLNKTTITSCEPALSVMDCVSREMSEKDGTNLLASLQVNHSKTSGGKTLKGFGYDRPDRTPERIAKAQAFHALVLERRKDKSRCLRCGHPRGEKYRMCDRCREKIRKAKLRAKGIAVVKGGEYSNADLAAMVLQMRREMDRMQARFKLWQKAADYRRNLHYRTNTMRKKYLKTVSHAEAMDYLAETNHAYENDETQAG